MPSGAGGGGAGPGRRTRSDPVKNHEKSKKCQKTYFLYRAGGGLVESKKHVLETYQACQAPESDVGTVYNKNTTNKKKIDFLMIFSGFSPNLIWFPYQPGAILWQNVNFVLNCLASSGGDISAVRGS